MILNFLTMKAKSVIPQIATASSSTTRTWLQESCATAMFSARCAQKKTWRTNIEIDLDSDLDHKQS